MPRLRIWVIPKSVKKRKTIVDFRINGTLQIGDVRKPRLLVSISILSGKRMGIRAITPVGAVSNRTGLEYLISSDIHYK